MSKFWLFKISIFLFYINLNSAKNILVLYPHKGLSIYGPVEAITHELAHRGYNVTVITPVSFREHVNITQVLIPDKFDYGRLQYTSKSFSTFKIAVDALSDGQRMIFSNEAVRSLFSADITFDLVITSDLPFLLVLSSIPYRYKCHSVTVINHGSVNFLSLLLGDPLNLATNPEAQTPFSDEMTFSERIYNFYVSLLSIILVHIYYIYSAEQVLDSLSNTYPFLKDRPPITEIIVNKSLIIMPTDHLFEYNYPRSPKIKSIAGLGIKKTKPVPEIFENFISNDDFILISWGSLLTIDFIQKYELLLVNSLKYIKQKIIWKSCNEKLQTLVPSNVMLTKWTPQQDLLAHKNIKLFITHGGLNSLTEAVYHGVPVIVIPFYLDQPKNAKFMEKTGAALLIEPKNITINSIFWAINEILHNPKYKNAAKARSEAFRDRMNSPVDEAVYWIEYILKHGNVFSSSNSTVPLYKQLLLDIILFIILILIAVYYSVKCAIKFVLGFTVRNGKEKSN